MSLKTDLEHLTMTRTMLIGSYTRIFIPHCKCHPQTRKYISGVEMLGEAQRYLTPEKAASLLREASESTRSSNTDSR